MRGRGGKGDQESWRRAGFRAIEVEHYRGFIRAEEADEGFLAAAGLIRITVGPQTMGVHQRVRFARLV